MRSHNRHALAIAQMECNLKHHDLHDKNVFIKKLVPGTMWKGVDLSGVKYFKYSAGPHVFYVENFGYLPQLAGLSSKTIHAPWECAPLELAAAGTNVSCVKPQNEWRNQMNRGCGCDA